jgi:vacuolar-type H+-ATPase subunit E/Vma4
MAQLSWAEAKSIMKQLEDLYSDPSDVLQVQQVRGVLSKLRETTETRKTSAQECIRKLTRRVEAAEEAMSHVPAKMEAQRSAELAELESSRQILTQRVADLSQQVQSLREERENMQREEEFASHIADDTVQVHARDMPRVQYAISLYATITGIKWDYNSPPDMLRGWVSSARLGEEAVLPFEFDLAIEGPGEQFRISNALWSIMDGKVPEEVGAAPADF